MTKRVTGELALIRWIAAQVSKTPRRRGPLACCRGVGDDCALLRGASPLVALTTDMLLDGVHFSTTTMSPGMIGRKTLAVSLSDVAAMGMTPAVAVVGVGLPDNASMPFARGLVRGMLKLANEYDVELVGGDVTSWPQGLCLCATVLGRAEGAKPVLRSGARPGHDVFVTGTLGGSRLRKHWAFTPRVREGRVIARTLRASAMIDVSDGLSTDLAHVADESRVGALLDAHAIPVASAAKRLAKRDGISPLEHALHDGEDFELLFTAPRSRRNQILQGKALPTPPALIGRIEAKPGLRIRDHAGVVRKLEPRGYEHFKHAR